MDTLIHNNQPAPLFKLPGLNGTIYSLEEGRGRVTILNFWSAECPWSARSARQLLSLMPVWEGKVAWWPIASNTNEPFDLLQRVAAEQGLPVVLQDAGHKVADLYGAQTTPHLFVIDDQGVLRYQGAPDDVTFRQRTPTHDYLRQAIEAVLSGHLPDPALTLPYGCMIVRI
jgi:peroxiredoxin